MRIHALTSGEIVALAYENGFSELATFEKTVRDWYIFAAGDGRTIRVPESVLLAGWVLIGRA